MSGDQFGAVHGHQGLAAFHSLAGAVDQQALDPAFKAGRHREQTALVGSDQADGAHRTAENTPPRRFGSHPHLLHFLRTDADLIAAGLFTLVDGDIVHPHRIFLGGRRSVWQPHRVAVIENLALLGGDSGRWQEPVFRVPRVTQPDGSSDQDY